MKDTKSPVIRQVDVARKAGMSQRTVSAVLGSSGAVRPHVNPATARRIRALADQMGYRPYRPAQQMKGMRSGIIGVLIGAAEVEVNYRRLSAIERLARENGYRLMVGYLHDSSHLDEYVDDFEARDVEGVLCLRHELAPTPPGAIPQRLASLKHVVYLDPPAGIEGACYVAMDRAYGIAQAVGHLHARGRRRIGLVLDVGRRSLPMRERLRGYRQGLAAVGLDVRDELIWTSSETLSIASPQIDRAVDELILGRRADAVLASNDEVAVALIKAMKRRGLRVPQDVAVVGYDNVSMGRVVEPELTTIDHGNDRIAPLMLNMLLTWIREGDLPRDQRQITVQPTLIVRESS